MPDPDQPAAVDGIVTLDAPGSVAGVVARLQELVTGRGMTLFAVVNHGQEAERHGLELRDTQVVIFGSPVGGTPVMQARPLAALDLPLKILVWDDGGQTRISYTDPAYLAARHRIRAELAAPLAGIAALAQALTIR